MSITAPSPRPRQPRLDLASWTGVVPFLVLAALWFVAPFVTDIPPYKLPTIEKVWDTAVTMTLNGKLPNDIGISLGRLALGYLIGNAIAIPLGLAIALNRAVAETLRPVLSFFQSIAGIAWVPLAIIWFGVGEGSVLFVIANTIFFASIYSTVIGVQSIEPVLYRAALCHGASQRQILTDVVVPGALVQIIVGLRTSMAYGWRALVAAEMIAGTSGIGYMTLEAVQWYQSEIVVLGMLVIGILWIILDRLIFVPIERVTVRRWGMIAAG